MNSLGFREKWGRNLDLKVELRGFKVDIFIVRSELRCFKVNNWVLRVFLKSTFWF